ncbi:SsrA-binding protein SmpB [Candidatus Deianiraea vastatrix]|uniref:SsrA-binding protein n=1 Tax=Candidatus Deianiraea vastatrix TaxID=2163644 RepID=A0A5B8XEY5_9RICK|nr:SsrA-binding protein SmpB [Candidatus Deianiraea vastatrix]QED23536.1 SsrA-binding protein [Candidatus Deianiraea vastatrix]
MSLIIENRRVRFEYFIEDVIEAGIVLTGSEVKSIRNKNVSLLDGFVTLKGGEPYLLNVNITKYPQCFVGQDHDPNRDKKLLLNKHEIRRLFGKIKEKGYTLVPLNLHLKRGKIKADIAVVKGKQMHDKRETIKKRDLERQTRRGND